MGRPRVSGQTYPNLLGSWSDSEHALRLDAVFQSVSRDACRTAHILVRGVSARPNQPDLQLFRPLVCLDSVLELADRRGKIWREGTVDVWLELGEINLNELIVLNPLILVKLSGVLACEVADLTPLGRSEVVVHAVVEWEEGGRCTNFGTLNDKVSQCR